MPLLLARFEKLAVYVDNSEEPELLAAIRTVLKERDKE